MQVVVVRYTAARMLSQRMARRVASPRTFVSSWAMHLRAHEGHCYHKGDTSRTCAASLRSRPGSVRTSPPTWSRMSPCRKRRRGHTRDRILLARVWHRSHGWSRTWRPRPCPQRALTNGHTRSPAVNHSSWKIGLDLAVWRWSRDRPASRKCLPGSCPPTARPSSSRPRSTSGGRQRQLLRGKRAGHGRDRRRRTRWQIAGSHLDCYLASSSRASLTAAAASARSAAIPLRTERPARVMSHR
jgi:hypothetical protein